MKYVADTHTLVWYFLDDSRVDKKIYNIIDNFKNLINIPTIVLAEIMFISKKGRITLSFEDTLKKIQEKQNLDIVSLDVSTIKIANGIEYELEMHDKLILATAINLGANLITKDAELQQQNLVKTVW